MGFNRKALIGVNRMVSIKGKININEKAEGHIVIAVIEQYMNYAMGKHDHAKCDQMHIHIISEIVHFCLNRLI